MDLETFIKCAKLWDRLGWAVQGQLVDVLDGEDVGEQNANAMGMSARFLDALAMHGVEGASELAGDIRRDLAKADAWA